MAEPRVSISLDINLQGFATRLREALDVLRAFVREATQKIAIDLDISNIKAKAAEAAKAVGDVSKGAKAGTGGGGGGDPGVAKQVNDQKQLTDAVHKTEEAFKKEGAASKKAGDDGQAAGGKLQSIFSSLTSKVGSTGNVSKSLGLDSLGSSIPGLSSGLGGLQGIIGKIPPQFALVAAGAVAVVAAFKGLLDIGEEFHKAFSTIRVGTGATGEALHQLESQFKQTFAGTADGSIETLSKNFADLNTQTGLTGAPLQALTTQFAALEKFGDAPSIRSFTRHLGDFGVPADKASAALDRIFVASQATGVPMGRLSDLLTQFGAPLRNFGFSIEEGTALLANFEKTGVNTELVMGSLRIASGKFARAGIDLKTGLFDAIKAIKEVGSSSEATALAMKTFGSRAGADMADTIRGGKFEIEGFINSLKGSKETILGARADVRSFGGTFEILSRQAKVALEPIGTGIVKGLTSAADAIGTVITPILTSIASLVTGLIIPLFETVVSRVSRIGEAFGSIFSSIASIGGASGQVGSAWSKIGDIISFLGTLFLGLQQIITEAIVAPIEIGADIIGQIVEFIGDISTGGQGAAGAWTGFNGILNGAKLSLSAIIGFISGIKDAFASVKDGISEGFSKLLSGDILGAIGSVKDGITGAVEGIGDSIDAAVNDQLLSINVEEGKKALEEKLKISKGLDLSKSVAELRAQLAAAGTDAERADIGAKLAATVPKAVTATKQVTDEFGNVTTQIQFAEDKLDSFIEKSEKAANADPSARQAAIVNGINAQIEQQKRLEEEAKKLSDELARQKILHGENSDEAKKAEGAFTEEQAKVKEGAEALSKSINEADGAGAFQGLAPAAKAAYDKSLQENSAFWQKAKEDKGVEELANTLAEASTLKGDLDKNDSIGGLIEKFQNASTQIEKDGIAHKIEEQVPGAIAKMDDLGHVTELNTTRVKNYADANGRAYSDKTLELQEKFKVGLNKQADALTESQDEVTRLTARFNEYSDKGQQAPKEVRDALEKARQKVVENTKALDGTVESGKKFGLLKGTAKEVGNEFGTSAKNVNAVEVSMGKAIAKGDELTESVSKIGEEFEKLRKESNEALNSAISEAAGLALKKQKEGLTAIEEQQLADARSRARVAVADQKTFDALVKHEEEAAGKIKIERAKRVSQTVSGLATEEYKYRLERQAKFITDDLQARIVAADTKAKIAKAEADLAIRQAQATYNNSAKDQAAQAAFNEAKGAADQKARHAEQDRLDEHQLIMRSLVEAGGLDRLKQQDEIAAAQAAHLRDNAEQIEALDVASVQRRSQLVNEALRIEGESKLSIAIVNSKAFAAAVKRDGTASAQAVADAQFALATTRQLFAEKKATQAQLDAAELAATAAQERQAAALAEIRAAFLQSLQVGDITSLTADQREALAKITAVIEANAAAVRKQTKENEKALAEAQLAARLATISDAGERERLARGDEIKKTLKEELRIVKDGEVELLRQAQDLSDRRTAIEAAFTSGTIAADARDAALAALDEEARALGDFTERAEGLSRRRLLAEVTATNARIALAEETARAEDKVLDASLLARESFLRAFGIATNAADLKAQRDRADVLRDETRKLKDEYDKRLISAEEYHAKLLELERKGGVERVKVTEIGAFVVKKIQEAGVDFTRRLSDSAIEHQRAGIDRMTQFAVEKAKLEADKKTAIDTGNVIEAEKLDKQIIALDKVAADNRIAIYTDTAIAIGATLGEFAAKSELLSKGAAKAALGIAFNFLQALVPIISAQILGLSLATPASIATFGTAGFIEWLGLTAALSGAVGIARGLVAGFADGVVDFQGVGSDRSDSNTVRISRSESIMTAKATRANRAAFAWANATGGDVRDWPGIFDSPRRRKDDPSTIAAGADSPELAKALAEQTAALSERISGLESATLRTNAILQQQRLTASTTIDGKGMHAVVEQAQRAGCY